jgi:hypothetical protein
LINVIISTQANIVNDPYQTINLLFISWQLFSSKYCDWSLDERQILLVIYW